MVRVLPRCIFIKKAALANTHTDYFKIVFLQVKQLDYENSIEYARVDCLPHIKIESE